MPPEPAPANSEKRSEMRQYERISLSVQGHLFDPQDETEIALTNSSIFPAAARLEERGRAGARQSTWSCISRVSGAMRGTVVQHSGGIPALNFTIGELKRKRLTEMLHQFVSQGSLAAAELTELRRYARSPTSPRDRNRPGKWRADGLRYSGYFAPWRLAR